MKVSRLSDHCSDCGPSTKPQYGRTVSLLTVLTFLYYFGILDFEREIKTLLLYRQYSDLIQIEFVFYNLS